MNEAPTRIYLGFDREEDGQCDLFITAKGFGISYVKESVVDELVEALKFAWPIIEHERYKWEGSYGKNFDSAKADRARQACEKAKAALAKLEESHD